MYSRKSCTGKVVHKGKFETVNNPVTHVHRRVNESKEEFLVTATYANQSKKLTLYIVLGNGYTLLGREWLQNIQLDWKRIAMITKDPLRASMYKKYTTNYGKAHIQMYNLTRVLARDSKHL